MLEHESINSIKNCSFECQNRHSHPIKKKILPNKCLITNLYKNLTLECERFEKKNVTPTQIGTVRIQIPCDCKLVDSNIILVNFLKPCDSKEFIGIKVENLVLAQWSKLQSSKLFPLDTGLVPKNAKLDECLNIEWVFKTPNFELPAGNKLEKMLLINAMPDIFLDNNLLIYITLSWCTILTILVIVLAFLWYVHNIKLKCMMPARYYHKNEN